MADDQDRADDGARTATDAGRGGDKEPGSAEVSRRRFLKWAVGGVAGAAAGAGLYALARRTIPEQYEKPYPSREGPQLPEGQDTQPNIDDMHRQRMEAFPAKTEGVGGQLLPFRVENGVKVFELETKVVQWEIEPGIRKEAWSYNGQVPGPQIRVKEGDRVRVHLKNGLPESTTIHWHGMRLLNQNAMDGVSYLTQPAVKPGASFTYEFTAYPPGTHMYHSHHNSTKQVAMGLLGPLIVEPKNARAEPRADLEETLVLNDGPLGFTINGKSFPATRPIVAKRGQRVRLRWMNEGAMMHPMHIHGLVMEVFARDGWRLPQPFRCDTLTVNPGERWDCIVEADNPGKWAIHCHVLPHAEGEHGMFGLVTAFIVEE